VVNPPAIVARCASRGPGRCLRNSMPGWRKPSRAYPGSQKSPRPSGTRWLAGEPCCAM
jgi:hypothetical protein